MTASRIDCKPMDSGLYELKPLQPEDEPEDLGTRTNRRLCPICNALRAAQVCHTCGVDLDTGEFAGIPQGHQGDDGDEADVVFPPTPLLPGVAPAWEPLRDYEDHRVPESSSELLARAIQEGLRTWSAPLLYFPLVTATLSFQTIPVANEPFPLPGQLVACFVLSFCLLERSRAAHEEAASFDLEAMAGLLARSLFLMPLLAGVGRLPLEAVAVIPVAAVLLPLVLGALSTDAWGELTPGNLATAFRATPGFTRTMAWCAIFMAAALSAVWAFPDGNAIWRGAVATAGATLCGAVSGSARRDAEIG